MLQDVSRGRHVVLIVRGLEKVGAITGLWRAGLVKGPIVNGDADLAIARLATPAGAAAYATATGGRTVVRGMLSDPT